MERQGNLVFLSRTYDEALDLVVEARDYVAYRERQDRRGMPADGRLQASCETMRMTARLTRVMSWLMMQKAVFHGEVSAAEAHDPDDRLAAYSTCLRRGHEECDDLPPHLIVLLERSYQLYLRVMRLEEVVAARLEEQSAA